MNNLKNILKRWSEKRRNKRMVKVYKDLAKISRKNNIVIVTSQHIPREERATRRLEPGGRLEPLPLGSFGYSQPLGRFIGPQSHHFNTDTIRSLYLDEEQIYKDEEQKVLSKDNSPPKAEPKPEPIISRKVNTAVLELEI